MWTFWDCWSGTFYGQMPFLSPTNIFRALCVKLLYIEYLLSISAPILREGRLKFNWFCICLLVENKVINFCFILSAWNGLRASSDTRLPLSTSPRPHLKLSSARSRQATVSCSASQARRVWWILHTVSAGVNRSRPIQSTISRTSSWWPPVVLITVYSLRDVQIWQ